VKTVSRESKYRLQGKKIDEEDPSSFSAFQFEDYLETDELLRLFMEFNSTF
jgi:hypothetical protein